ncbi:hypothetical protein [Paraburkholderia kirstenboschensis]|uniref:Uncharacterized protein n=1 Tax=Paraburkholderia kirstenboschensis TaxID=1245436 RepID=A0ABZ0EAL3_9BURK|nr:hypothetical protein [Paraburkholderia kirstenboschensis]WOD14251.1 hypothetical protein RW095_01715 [Paraburkholderia kirstenboschensis]
MTRSLLRVFKKLAWYDHAPKLAYRRHGGQRRIGAQQQMFAGKPRKSQNGRLPKVTIQAPRIPMRPWLELPDPTLSGLSARRGINGSSQSAADVHRAMFADVSSAVANVQLSSPVGSFKALSCRSHIDCRQLRVSMSERVHAIVGPPVSFEPKATA